MIDYGSKVWEPTAARAQNTAMNTFFRFAETRTGLSFKNYSDVHDWSVREPGAFWSAVAAFTNIRWQVPPTDPIFVPPARNKMIGAQWFPGAKLNYAENLLSDLSENRVLTSYCEGLAGPRHFSGKDLGQQVARCAHGLRALGVKKGDRVAAMLANTGEAVIAMLAATSLGAVWSSCSPDFGAHAMVERFGQIEPKVFFFTPQYCYATKRVETADAVKEALKKMPSVIKAIAIDHLAEDGGSEWRSFLAAASSASLIFTPCDFNDPLFILYSSGTTGVPKCIVHSVGGTLLQHVKELSLHSDVNAGDALFFFTTCGWMMWNWTVSALAQKARLVLFDGAPGYPDMMALWQMVDTEGVTVFGTSPKFIQSSREAGIAPQQELGFKALKAILSTGSPLLPEHYSWIYGQVKSDLHLASISGGTDIISCFMLGNPMAPVYAGEIQAKGLGMAIHAALEDGTILKPGEKGELICVEPFPSMPIGFWKDPDGRKFHKAYFEYFPDREIWRHGDFVSLTDHGGVIVYGRSDSTLNPSGIRIGTAEIYRVLEGIPHVADAVAVSLPEEKGDAAVILFIKMQWGRDLTDELKDEIRKRIRTSLSPRHVPSEIAATPDIPYTRSGKKVEVAVQTAILGDDVRNLTSLTNPDVMKFFVKWGKQRKKAKAEGLI